MEQFLQGGAEAIAFFIANFRFIMRYQDDRWAGNSTYLQRSMYSSQFWGTQDDSIDAQIMGPRGHEATIRWPWRGIYPACLNIKTEQCDVDTVTHQDTRIIRWITNTTDVNGGTPTYRYRVQLYDKKTDAAYDKLREHIIRWCNPDTMLADSAIYGVAYSQVHRFAHRCSWAQEFEAVVHDTYTSMMDMGYDKHKLFAQFDKFARKYPDLYGPQRLWRMRARVREITRND